MLGVVTRIGLVRHQPRQVRHQLLDVGIDGDRRAVVAQVVVEARPRLVGHHLILDGFAVGKRILGADPVAQRAGERLDAFAQPIRRDLLGPAMRRHPVGQRAGAAQGLVEPDVCLAVRLVVAFADAHVEVVVHLVDEADCVLRRTCVRRIPVRADERPHSRRVADQNRCGAAHLAVQSIRRRAWRTKSAGSGAGSAATVWRSVGSPVKASTYPDSIRSKRKPSSRYSRISAAGSTHDQRYLVAPAAHSAPRLPD